MDIDIERFSECKQRTNNYGQRLIEMCKGLNTLIVNGRLGEDSSVGKCTWKNVAVDDYVISNPRLFPLLCKFKVCEFNPLLSDGHSVIEFSLDADENTVTQRFDNLQLDEKTESVSKPYGRWKPEKSREFVENLDTI